MLVIGLTGGIGSGKSAVASLFASEGACIIDTDQLARDVIHPGKEALKQIVTKFGKSILKPDGTLNRPALRKIIFENSEDRIWLEKLLHPLIRLEMKNQVEASTSPYCIVVIPLLFESKPNPLINRVLVVDAPEDMQITRTQARDKASEEDVTAILKTQVSREQRLSKADDIIENHGTLENLIPQVKKLHQFYLSLSNLKL